MRRTIALSIATLLAGAAFAQASDARLSVSRDPAGNVIATVEGTVRACGITTTGNEPTFVVRGNLVEVTQPKVAIACMNPPPKTKPYRQTLDLGKLAPGKYTIRWSFPELSAEYVVPPK